MPSLTFHSGTAAFTVVGLVNGQWHYWDAKRSQAVPLESVRDKPNYLDLMTFESGFRMERTRFVSGHIKLFRKDSRPDFFISRKGKATFNEPNVTRFDFNAPFMNIEFTLTEDCWFNWTYVEHISSCFEARVKAEWGTKEFKVTPEMMGAVRQELKVHGLTNLIKGQWILSPKSDPGASEKIMKEKYDPYIAQAWEHLKKNHVTFDGNLQGRVEGDDFVLRTASRNEYERFSRPTYRQFLMNEPGRPLRHNSMVSRFFCMLIREVWKAPIPAHVPKEQWYRLQPPHQHAHPYAAAIARHIPTGYGFPYGELYEKNVLMKGKNVDIIFDFSVNATGNPSLLSSESNQCYNWKHVWNTPATDSAGTHTIGNRILWLQAQGKTDQEAKQQVANEFPAICGARTSVSWINVWNTPATDGSGTHSIGDRITWLQTQGRTEKEAKIQVAKEFPAICGACITTTNESN